MGRGFGSGMAGIRLKKYKKDTSSDKYSLKLGQIILLRVSNL
jgi:hypothetical protein